VPPRYRFGFVTFLVPKRLFVCQLLMCNGAPFAPETNLVDEGLFSGAVFVAYRGEVLLSGGYSYADRERKISNTPQTQFQIASMTKQFTAVAILILQEDGEVNVSDQICSFIVDCPPTWQEITIHHLLTHTSGIPNYDYRELDVYKSPDTTTWSHEEFITAIKEWPPDFQPGEKWSYSNSGYIILGYIIEQVSGQPYETFLRQSIFNPLNMESTGYLEYANNLALGYLDRYTTEPVSNLDVTTLFASGGLYSNVEDLYRWSQALYGDQLLSQASRDQMFTPYAVTGDGEAYASYGYACFIHEHKGHPVIWHGGSIAGFSTTMIHHPAEQVTIILLSNIDVAIVKVEYLASLVSDKIFEDD